MDASTRDLLGAQLGATIDMLDRAVVACPETLWGDREQRPEFWYTVFHALFWLDLYLTGAAEGFAPPPPFGLEELDPAGVLPERVYGKDELRAYLAHCRDKGRATIAALSPEGAARRCRFAWGEVSFAELVVYNLRHVQHHAGQLYLILRQRTAAAPGWVARAGAGTGRAPAPARPGHEGGSP